MERCFELELYGKEAALCDGEARVVPGDAAGSYLIDKLRGTGCGACVDLSTDSKHCGACSSNGCHDASGRPGVGPGGGATSLDLAAGNALQSLLATTTPCGPVLVPGDPGSSVLVGKLDGTELCMGSLMPKGNGSLTTQEIDLIATWVCQGAAGN